MEQIVWEVRYLEPPKVIRHCKKCRTKAEYTSSEHFRVNAQQKSLDIWLIYRCTACKTTWNLTIYSRISPNSIDCESLNKFLSNDIELAKQYAMDTDLLKRNGAKPETPQYCVLGDPIDFTKDVELRITSRHLAQIRVEKILREKLSLTRKDFDQMVSSKVIRLKNDLDIHKSKINHEIVVLVSACQAS